MPDWISQLQQRLDLHQAQGLMRNRNIQSVRIDLNFTSHDYLSLAKHPEIIQTLQQALITDGVGALGSPVAQGYTHAHQQLETRIKNWVNYPDCLVFTSGYLAVLASITALVAPDDVIAVDKQSHASVFEAIQLSKATWQRYADDDEARLENILQNRNKGARFIITSSVFSMQGHLANLKRLLAIAKKYDATLIVDDVHGSGVLGQEGQGAHAHAGLNNQEIPLIIGSLTKGLGTVGAFVAGHAVLVETILQFSKPYMFSTTLPSALAAASTQAIDIAANAKTERAHLQTLIAYFQQQARALGLNILPSTTPIQAIVFADIISMQRCAQHLLEKNILVSPIRPPTVPAQSPRIRITLTAAHQLTDIDRLLQELTHG